MNDEYYQCNDDDITTDDEGEKHTNNLNDSHREPKRNNYDAIDEELVDDDDGDENDYYIESDCYNPMYFNEKHNTENTNNISLITHAVLEEIKNKNPELFHSNRQ